MADDFLSFFAGCNWQTPSAFPLRLPHSATTEHFGHFFGFCQGGKMEYVNCLF